MHFSFSILDENAHHALNDRKGGDEMKATYEEFTFEIFTYTVNDVELAGSCMVNFKGC